MVLTRADAASKLGTVTISATTSEELNSLLSGSDRHSSVLLPPGAVVERRSPPTAESQLFTVTLRRQPPSYWRGQARPGGETLGFTPTVLQLQVLYPYYIKHRQGSGISMEGLREHLIRDGSLKTTPWLIPTLEELDAWWTSENNRRSRPVTVLGKLTKRKGSGLLRLRMGTSIKGGWLSSCWTKKTPCLARRPTRGEQRHTVRKRAPLGKHEHRGAWRC